MKKVLVILMLMTINMMSFAQSAADLLYEKGMEYYNLKKVFDGNSALSMYTANRYFKQAGELGKAEAFEYSKKLDELGYISTAEYYSEELRNKAENENPDALYALAQCYQYGWGVSLSRDKASRYYSWYTSVVKIDNMDTYMKYMAAIVQQYIAILQTVGATEIESDIVADLKDCAKKSFFKPAQVSYAFLLVDSHYPKKNYKKGVELFESAARQDRIAALMMHKIYRNGLYGKEKNDNLSEMWYNRFKKM